MNIHLRRSIDDLETKIKDWRGDCIKCAEAKLEVEKIKHQIENIRNDSYSDLDDLPPLLDKLCVAKTDVEWYNEAVDTGLYALKYSAYKVGRHRSIPRAEP